MGREESGPDRYLSLAVFKSNREIINLSLPSSLTLLIQLYRPVIEENQKRACRAILTEPKGEYHSRPVMVAVVVTR